MGEGFDPNQDVWRGDGGSGKQNLRLVRVLAALCNLQLLEWVAAAGSSKELQASPQSAISEQRYPASLLSLPAPGLVCKENLTKGHCTPGRCQCHFSPQRVHTCPRTVLKLYLVFQGLLEHTFFLGGEVQQHRHGLDQVEGLKGGRANGRHDPLSSLDGWQAPVGGGRLPLCPALCLLKASH